ncbi:Large subunit GTPase 1 [Penicillium hetheringtonii]|uniref:Large subunit GTPase 1 n=1 Tax=Penicillium hetheringtonii TaxID=911720 RepID=A0AAD6DKF2_9EURO|nr:Large subunit GTPase 1 [Penicillium hetheringtonii]
MVLAKSKNSVGLGNSLMNDRFGKGKASKEKKASHNNAIARKGINGETYITNAAQDASWVKMRSITEQAALDEFLSTAELAGTDFTAEKMSNVKIIHSDQKNPYLLSASEEKSTVKKHKENKARLTTTTPAQLEMMERESLLSWRRGLAELQENQDLLMTPFERNLEVWRQLWRVIERSDLIVQIVDARNPLQFRSEDLENYVKEIDPRKKNLLKEKHGLNTSRRTTSTSVFFAHLAKEKMEAQMLEEGQSGSEDEDLNESTKKMNVEDNEAKDTSNEVEENLEEQQQEEEVAKLADPDQSLGPHILDVEELEELFLANTPETLPQNQNPTENSKQKTTIGLVGYPNVGKSSTINALLGAKKVSVSATPGKTKHFQTLYLSPEIMLCDCPGLVFPNFATTKADLVVNGVLPIDQQREFTGPAGLVAKRVPKSFIENVYGVQIKTRPIEEGGTGIPTASDILRAYARARGFSTQGLGQPDESRAARYVLKDYVNAENEEPIDPNEFNQELYDIAHLPPKRQAMLAKSIVDLDANVDADISALVAGQNEIGSRSRNIDSGFFGTATGPSAGRLNMPFNHKYTDQGQEMRKNITGRKERMMIALERGVDVSEVRSAGSKKHNKGNKRRAKGKRNNPAGDDDYY